MWKPALAVLAALVLTVPTVTDAAGGDPTPTTPISTIDTSAPPKPVCDRRCHLKREYRKLRRSTSRNPIPAYVVECESHGQLHAQQIGGPAGGRYQIEPPTWKANLPSKRFIGVAESAQEHFRRLGRNHGPRWSGRLLQDRVAANIRAGSGLGAWTCS